MNPPLFFRAAGVADAAGLAAAPGGAIIQRGRGLPRLIACGRADEVATHEAARSADAVDLPDAVLLPPLVNAHTHLDLTHIGPRTFDPAGGFAGWARMIIAERLHDAAGLRRSVEEGIRRSVAGGVAAVGDIAGFMHLEPVCALQGSPMLGVSFVEFFGMGRRQEESAARMADLLNGAGDMLRHARVRVGLQPHAPYTAGLRLYRWSAAQHHARGTPLATHLAETISEREFVSRATGPSRALLEELGLWDDSITDEVGKQLHPIAHVSGVLAEAPWLVAHVNDCDDTGLKTLTETRTSVAYCPRSSAYFLNHEAFGPHRYRDMLRAGVNVCLGTDSIVNLPPAGADRISTLDEMRFLYRRDGTDPTILLRMATVNGARALGLDESLFTLGTAAGPRLVAGLIAVEVGGTPPDAPPLGRVMQSGGGVSMLAYWGDGGDK